MVEEFQALEKQKTWTLVPYQPSMNVVGCKWVFKLKRNDDGSISCHKARLVAKGYHQKAGLDYDETFSLVVKHSTVHLVLALAAQFHWTIKQLDVKNVFLHGIIHKEGYMQQPPGFTDSKQPHHVCRLLKSLYGLKQAPRAWNERFTTHLLTLGFVSKYILQTITALGREFDMKDLGKLTYFLGLQFMHTPTEPHFAAVKRVLRYLAGTLTHGIHFTSNDVQLQAYSDADWDGDVNDKHSTTRYVVFLCNNPISWCAKKQSTVSHSST
ncbi:unnamed protein product [Prunus armeniaca]